MPAGRELPDPLDLSEDERRRLSGWLLAWINAVELQYQRVTPSPEKTSSDGQYDLLLFVDALANFERAARAILPTWHPALLGYQRSVGSGTAVRDLVTHYDAYVLGVGALQSAGTVDAFDISFERSEDSMAVSVAGHLLDVTVAYQAAMRLHAEVLTFEHGTEEIARTLIAEAQQVTRPLQLLVTPAETGYRCAMGSEDGTVIHPHYSEGRTELLAILAAEQRYLVEQGGHGAAKKGETYLAKARERIRQQVKKTLG